MSEPSANGQTVIITGASSGIGLALAAGFLARGDNVVGNGRDAARLDAAAARLGFPGRFIAVAGDIGQAATAAALFDQAEKRFGRVDILINNAGVFIAKPAADYTEEDIDLLIATNLKGFVYPVQQAARHMGRGEPGRESELENARGGQIINVSAAIALSPNAQVPALLPVLIKGGINSATRALALELGPRNIRVNTVAPGIIDTPMYDAASHGFLNTLQPAGRIGTVADVVNAALYLSTAPFVTGTVLAVDGGMSSGKW